MPRTSVERLRLVKGIGLDVVAAAAADRPEVLRLENLDTGLPVPSLALATTRRALEEYANNTWLLHVHLVFSNEPLERLRGLGQRVHRALG